jgi:hypothetical protein
MMVDVVMKMDDIDIDRETVETGRIEMARDKLTKVRIARSQVVAKRKSGRPGHFCERVKFARLSVVFGNFALGKKFRGFPILGTTANNVRR